MRTYRIRFLGATVWLVVLALVSLPFACAPAFLCFLHNMQVECRESPSPAA